MASSTAPGSTHTAERPQPSSGRDRRRARTRLDLARVAVERFERNGFAATTVEEIAAAADYSASTFFRLFPRKEDVVFFDLVDRLGVALPELAHAVHDGDWPTIKEALLRHASHWEARDLAFAEARTRLFHAEPALSGRYLELCAQWEAELAALIAERRGNHATDDMRAFLAAGVIVTAYRAAFRAQAHSGGPLTDHLKRALDHIANAGHITALLRD